MHGPNQAEWRRVACIRFDKSAKSTFYLNQCHKEDFS